MLGKMYKFLLFWLGKNFQKLYILLNTIKKKFKNKIKKGKQFYFFGSNKSFTKSTPLVPSTQCSGHNSCVFPSIWKRFFFFFKFFFFFWFDNYLRIFFLLLILLFYTSIFVNGSLSCVDANETCPTGCESCVNTTKSNKPELMSLLIGSIILSDSDIAFFFKNKKNYSTSTLFIHFY